MTKFLVTFSEVIEEVIEVSGFSIMNDKEVLRFEELANSITWPFTYEYSDGTELNFSSGEDFLSTITFKEITQEESKMFNRIFNDKFGTFIGESFLNTVINEEDDEEIDNDDENIDFTYGY